MNTICEASRTERIIWDGEPVRVSVFGTEVIYKKLGPAIFLGVPENNTVPYAH